MAVVLTRMGGRDHILGAPVAGSARGVREAEPPAPRPGRAQASTTISAAGAVNDFQEAQAFMPNTVFLGAARTPIGKMGGGLSTLAATELGGLAI